MRREALFFTLCRWRAARSKALICSLAEPYFALSLCFRCEETAIIPVAHVPFQLYGALMRLSALRHMRARRYAQGALADSHYSRPLLSLSGAAAMFSSMSVIV